MDGVHKQNPNDSGHDYGENLMGATANEIWNDVRAGGDHAVPKVSELFELGMTRQDLDVALTIASDW